MEEEERGMPSVGWPNVAVVMDRRRGAREGLPVVLGWEATRGVIRGGVSVNL